MTPSSESTVAASSGAFPVPDDVLDGRYRLGTVLGQGGMGVVFRAEDEQLHRTVAIKVFRAGADEMARTQAETRILAGLNHESLVTLFDAHLPPSGAQYLVMEYVEGPSLKARLESGPLAASDVAAIAADLAEGLHTVHHAGVVHRDIKPANVLLRASRAPGREFRAKLADFGIAYLIDSTRVTTPGMVVGTAAYLSPEQVRGAEPAAVSDIYSLGLVLLECLTGRRAFAQSGVIEASIVRLSQSPDIPAEIGSGWATLLCGMTSRDPERRPTALQVAEAVRDIDSYASTATVPIGEPAGDAADHPDREPLAPTMVLPGPTTTRLLAPSESAPASDDGPSASGRQRSRRGWALGAVVFLVAAVVVVLMVWTSIAGGSPPPPTLPSVGEPLDSHLRELLDAVSP